MILGMGLQKTMEIILFSMILRLGWDLLVTSHPAKKTKVSFGVRGVRISHALSELSWLGGGGGPGARPGGGGRPQDQAHVHGYARVAINIYIYIYKIYVFFKDSSEEIIENALKSMHFQ